jgi:hypothetical protein
MDRRRYLSSLAATGLAGIAGCGGDGDDGDDGGETTTASDPDATTEGPSDSTTAAETQTTPASGAQNIQFVSVDAPETVGVGEEFARIRRRPGDPDVHPEALLDGGGLGVGVVRVAGVDGVQEDRRRLVGHGARSSALGLNPSWSS